MAMRKEVVVLEIEYDDSQTALGRSVSPASRWNFNRLLSGEDGTVVRASVLDSFEKCCDAVADESEYKFFNDERKYWKFEDWAHSEGCVNLVPFVTDEELDAIHGWTDEPLLGVAFGDPVGELGAITIRSEGK
jgi:hypothetical protein